MRQMEYGTCIALTNRVLQEALKNGLDMVDVLPSGSRKYKNVVNK